MRFLVDAQLPPALAKFLEAEGHEAEHVNRIALGSASDLEVWRYACATRSILVTKDADFLEMARSDTNASAVVWIRLGNVTNAWLAGVFGKVLPDIIESVGSGERVVEIR